MSHHSSHDDPELRAEMHERMKKIFGEYPDGKLNDEDEGAIVYAIGHEKGRVILQFPKPVKWMGATPEQALEMAQALIKHAQAAGYNKPLILELTKAVRLALPR